MSLKRKIIHYKGNGGNSNNRDHFIAVAATIFVLAVIMAASSMATNPISATTPTTSNTTATSNSTSSTPLSSSGIELSPQPIFQERSPPGNITPINETHGVLTFTGNGTLTLPNTTQTINTTSNGTAIISFATSSGYAKETIRATNDESATAILFEIVQFNNPATAPEGGGNGIVTAVLQTNSTGTLAPLNGMIAAGIDDLTSSGESHITLWQWESGISNSGVASSSTNTTSTQGSLSTNSSSNTTTTTNEASSPSSSSPLTSLY